ncbi:glutathione S-transferase family protein [Azospirillum sp.]|uniref:glutathione S-transferase family protein n=1 Tax=Azospirillum sp. TaxID=34012 RepID=UPI002D2E0190|nr:glutathione S-transferase N-terminal domain-containing protein [Azospirillum sp.]HYD69733.1 glutathione S-transferase N-terminal domain-containing protein [Azospirillum sp.]
MITLYNMPSTAGMAPHIVLREIGAPHRMVLLDGDAKAQKAPEYLALNPHGRVPTLVDGDLVISESAAICLHLAETHPQAGLVPPLGSAERARLVQWLVYLTNTVQAEMMPYFYPDRYVPEEGAAALRARVEARLAGMFAHIDGELAGRTWLLGERYTIADPYLFMLARWTRNMTRKARDLPNLGPYLARVYARPAVAEALKAEGIGEPYY